MDRLGRCLDVRGIAARLRAGAHTAAADQRLAADEDGEQQVHRPLNDRLSFQEVSMGLAASHQLEPRLDGRRGAIPECTAFLSRRDSGGRRQSPGSEGCETTAQSLSRAPLAAISRPTCGLFTNDTSRRNAVALGDLLSLASRSVVRNTTPVALSVARQVVAKFAGGLSRASSPSARRWMPAR